MTSRYRAGPGPAFQYACATPRGAKTPLPALLRLIEELHVAPLPGREAVETIFRKYDSELL